MRFKVVAALTLVSSFSVLAGAASAQISVQPSQNGHSAQVQQQSQGAPPPGQRPMAPGMVVSGGMAGPMGGQTTIVRTQAPSALGPLQSVTKLLSALDDTRVRTLLGITDQQ